MNSMDAAVILGRSNLSSKVNNVIILFTYAEGSVIVRYNISWIDKSKKLNGSRRVAYIKDGNVVWDQAAD